MAVTLSPTEVTDRTGATVTGTDITDAASLIEQRTGYTPDEHNTVRLVAAGNVQRAWAIVTARLCAATTTDGSSDIAGESKGDYSYSRFSSGDRVKQQIAIEADLLAGLPWTLLELATVSSTHLSWRAG